MRSTSTRRACRRPTSTRWKGTEDYQQYDGLGTYYYGFNVKNITDVNQRRAMSFAIDRQSIIDNIAQAGQIPAHELHAEGHARLRHDQAERPADRPRGDMDKAKELMAKVENPKKNINLLINDSPGHKEIAVAVQSFWKNLGLTTTIKQQEWAQFLEFLGPPPDKSVDAYRNGLDRRLRRRHQLPRAVDVRVGQQQHELLRPGVRQAGREGQADARRHRPLRHLQATRGQADRPGRRHADRADLLVHLRPAREAVDRQDVQHEPARPVGPHEAEGGGALARSSSGGGLRPAPGQRAAGDKRQQ